MCAIMLGNLLASNQVNQSTHQPLHRSCTCKLVGFGSFIVSMATNLSKKLIKTFRHPPTGPLNHEPGLVSSGTVTSFLASISTCQRLFIHLDWFDHLSLPYDTPSNQSTTVPAILFTHPHTLNSFSTFKPLLNWANFFFANLVRELKKASRM